VAAPVRRRRSRRRRRVLLMTTNFSRRPIALLVGLFPAIPVLCRRQLLKPQRQSLNRF